MNSETPETDAKVAAICDRYPLSGTNVEWFLRFHELASFTGSLELRCKRLEEALRQATEQIEADYEPTPLDGRRALVSKLREALSYPKA